MEKEIDNITFHEGLPSSEQVDTWSEKREHMLLILDDLLATAVNDVEVLNLFTLKSHHQNISLLMLTQNLYHSPEMSNKQTKPDSSRENKTEAENKEKEETDEYSEDSDNEYIQRNKKAKKTETNLETQRKMYVQRDINSIFTTKKKRKKWL
ncbi:unnamed protein product [Mytilus coruscus]|uniref:Uncharacterized protein n=1 Tax=Mytilus coruscus TaxID=42192 RepID=A0A6J8DVS6_MYTCO|nr:unnamed protein product [Mytilus coruscus]